MDWILSSARVGAALALMAAYVALCAGIAWRQRQRSQAARREQQQLQAGSGHGPAVLVAYASQTGQAEALAHESARVLHEAGCAVRLMSLQEITQADLRACAHSLWVVATCGEGDAPDQALGFVRRMLDKPLDLEGHEAHVLALGDREYVQFCAFGLRVQAWLEAQKAQTAMLCMSNMDEAVLRSWREAVGGLVQRLTGRQADAWTEPEPERLWVLQRRQRLNPGSQGGAVYLLDWVPESGALPTWESGDLVSLCVESDPERPRDYSIANVSSDGCLQLLVRQSTRADGTPGLASDWLCTGLEEGGRLALRLRAHSGFRLGDNAHRPLILIGNGTGLAGLCSHIKARVARGCADQWLVFGERHPEHDALLDAQLQQWLAQGQLARLDRAWSRHAQTPGYVQHVLAAEAGRLKSWVERGAAIYVCGSQQGMAQAVDQLLRELLGSEPLDALALQGRYRRDVY
ncbi:sulfite reductase subunit alpha [Comamonas composti]|uniref:sulfite reductase subunit alpha n=1 Tax=Comamonas composti TaxID=408558 RepID=UPI00042512E1|nr:sulfite reductase subunit alpha [Comamonas composti]